MHEPSSKVIHISLDPDALGQRAFAYARDVFVETLLTVI